MEWRKIDDTAGVVTGGHKIWNMSGTERVIVILAYGLLEHGDNKCENMKKFWNSGIGYAWRCK